MNEGRKQRSQPAVDSRASRPVLLARRGPGESRYFGHLGYCELFLEEQRRSVTMVRR